MKRASKANIIAIGAIISIFLISGIANVQEIIESVKPIINLPKIAFAGFISFAIVGGIMAIGNSVGIWFGKASGSIMYAITLFIVGSILF